MIVAVLVLFLKMGYGAGAVTLDFHNMDQCQIALTEAKKMQAFEDGHCIDNVIR